MAGDWIKMRISIGDDPDVIAIAGRLDCDEDMVVGKLLRFWGWCSEHTTDGNASGVTQMWLDRFVGVTNFADAMVSVGWLEVGDDGLKVPDFDRYLSEGAKQRALASIRQAKHRVKKGNAPSVTEPSPREEKRRGKRKGKEKAAKAAAPSKADALRTMWNGLEGFPEARPLSAARKKALGARIKEPGWWDAVPQALAKMAESPFCRGQNSRNWVATLDWFLQSDTQSKILEGKYGNGKKPATTQARDLYFPSEDDQ